MLSAMRLRAIARKEMRQLRRDPRSMLLAFALPLLMLIFFGYAITWDITDLELAVRDEDGTRASRELVAALTGSGYFDVKLQLASRAPIDGLLERGAVDGVLVIPRGFSRDLAAGRPAPVQLLLDGADANTATIALNYADAIVARWSAEVVLQGRTPPGLLRAESRVWYNPTLESRNMIVPGLIAVIMSIIAAMLTALTIAREWERGTMEQLAATPAHRVEIVLGKLLPYLAIGCFDVAITTVAGLLVFGVPLRGSVLLLGAMTLLFLLGALGLGLFISAALRSQLLATQIALVATYLPALLLSGFLFDVASMPVPLQAVSQVVPARYYITVTRGIFLKGTGLEELWLQGLYMVLFALLGLGAAVLVFRKRIAA
jgi:ABC-2 type transport system permease protein